MSFYDKLPTAKPETEIETATHRVAVLQTWMDNAFVIQNSLKQAVHNGAKVQLLFISPDSVMLQYRAKEYLDTLSLEDARTRLVSQIRGLRAFCDKEGISASVEIRLYDGTSVLALYAVDDIVYIGTFWRGGSAMQCPQIKAK